MAGASVPADRQSVRIAVVEEHIRLENKHDLEGVLGTFGETAQYDDEPWNEHYRGLDGVRRFYEQLMRALPDLEIDVQRRHTADDTILLEVIFAERIWARGAVFLRPDDESNSPSAACIPLTPKTVCLEKKSTTTEQRY